MKAAAILLFLFWAAVCAVWAACRHDNSEDHVTLPTGISLGLCSLAIVLIGFSMSH